MKQEMARSIAGWLVGFAAACATSVVLALLLAAAIRLHDRVAIVLASIGLLVGAYQFGGAALSGFGRADRESTAQGSEVRLITQSTWHSNPDPEALLRTIERQRPDIAVLQETDRATAQAVDRMLPGYHRIKSCRWQHCSLTMLSRWPLRRIQLKSPRHAALPDLLIADVSAPFGNFRVIGVHLPRPGSPKFATFADQLTQIARESESTPLVVAGDFNTATGSFGLSRFARATRLRRIDGYLPTYPAHMTIPAFMGIDHVFIGKGWRQAGCRRVKGAASDHHGIACLLRMVP